MPSRNSRCPAEEPLVWYVAYGSNLALDRLRHYLGGGRPEGALRSYAGARDHREPRAVRELQLRGGLRFAGVSRAWTGGMAFFDATVEGTVAARAYLLARQQVEDLVAQEIRLPPGTPLDLLAEAAGGRRPLPGTGYDVALRLEDLAGHPAVLITGSAALDPNPPAEAYLRWICRGLQEGHGWGPDCVASYLSRFPGVAGSWPEHRLRAIAEAA